MNVQLLIWNVRGLGNEGSQRHLNYLVWHHKVSLVGIVEPMAMDPDITRLNRQVGLQLTTHNSSNKIWFFCARSFSADCLLDAEQALHLKISSASLPNSIFITIVYAKCSRQERLSLWASIREIALNIEGCPWLIGGGFNIFLEESERVGSDRDWTPEMNDFADVISDCQLLDPGFVGPLFTWERENPLLRER